MLVRRLGWEPAGLQKGWLKLTNFVLDFGSPTAFDVEGAAQEDDTAQQNIAFTRNLMERLGESCILFHTLQHLEHPRDDDPAMHL